MEAGIRGHVAYGELETTVQLVNLKSFGKMKVIGKTLSDKKASESLKEPSPNHQLCEVNRMAAIHLTKLCFLKLMYLVTHTHSSRLLHGDLKLYCLNQEGKVEFTTESPFRRKGFV